MCSINSKKKASAGDFKFLHGLVWTVGLTVEVKFRFSIPPAYVVWELAFLAILVGRFLVYHYNVLRRVLFETFLFSSREKLHFMCFMW